MSQSQSVSDDEMRREHEADLRHTQFAFLVALTTTLAAIGLSAVSHDLSGTARFGAFQTIAGDWLIATAAFLVGALPGFLFAIPRSVNQDSHVGGTAATAEIRRPLYQASNNLTEISDWLTKILVGLGLAEMARIKSALLSVSQFASSLLPSPASSAARAEALAIILASGAFGFFAGYLWTRLRLSGAFAHAERAGFLPGRRDLVRTQLEFRRNLAASTSLTTAAQRAADKLEKRPLRSLTRFEDIVAWAKAQASAGRYDLSADAFQRAIELKPASDALRVERAVVLSAGGHHDAALRELRALTRALEKSDDPNLRRRTVEGLMYNYLYENPPHGFQRAIEVGREALEDEALSKSAAVWMYLTCAYGQQYGWERVHQDEQSSERDLEAIRDEAYATAQQALTRDPSLRPLMRGFLEGKHGDDDLTPFKRDPAFRALLGAQ